MTLFNHLFKDPISRCSHILKCWGLGSQHEFQEDTIQPTTRCNWTSPILGVEMDVTALENGWATSMKAEQAHIL